jgi:hypothetical protein
LKPAVKVKLANSAAGLATQPISVKGDLARAMFTRWEKENLDPCPMSLNEFSTTETQTDFLIPSPPALKTTVPVPVQSDWATRAAKARKIARSGTFVDNLKLPVHRWFRYSAGFSAKWVESVLAEKKSRRLFDPFAGSGTSLLAADTLSVPSVGTESHPFVHRIARSKLAWNFDPIELSDAANELIRLADGVAPVGMRDPLSLVARIYTPQTLQKLEALRVAQNEIARRGYSTEITDLLWLAITAILRPCSFVGTAQWQYVLPSKTKSVDRDPRVELNGLIDQMLTDRDQTLLENWQKHSSVVAHDARTPFVFADEEPFDAVITSPPYPNNYDYADATRLEMTFWGDITGWSDLQHTVRRHLMHSCSQHTAAERLKLPDLLSAPVLAPIHAELSTVCQRLAEIRLTKGGKKTYHTMIAAYFQDLGHIFKNLRTITSPGATVCFVIGDSAPYGVHVPAERWLGELALAAGFINWRFEKLRDRNIKWDNRVHDVPLQEGNLWIQG